MPRMICLSFPTFAIGGRLARRRAALREATRPCALVLAVLTGACGSGSPAAPGPATPAAGGAGVAALTVVSGADGAAVEGATVRVGDRVLAPDTTASGTNVFVGPAMGNLLGQPLEVEAAGYLPRVATVTGEKVELWPVANDADADAVADLVYVHDNAGRRRLFKDGHDFLLKLDASVPPETRRHLLDAAARLNPLHPDQLVGLAGEPIPGGFTADSMVELRVLVDRGGGPCGSVAPIGGICEMPARTGSYDDEVWLASSAAADPATALRLVARIHLVGFNRQPGLLNRNAPQPDLSPLEETAIRMLAKRRPCNEWPDTDRGC